MIFLALFALTIPTANWLIGHVGTACVCRRDPVSLPVAPGLMAPSGVMMVGVALVLRDLVQRRLGVGPFGLAHPGRQRPVGLVRAAVAGARVRRGVPAFGVRRSRGLYAAGAPPPGRRRWSASSVVGLVVDSIVFLWLAFGSLDFLAGQVVGKAWMVFLSIPFWLGCAAATSGSASRRHDLPNTRRAMSDAVFDILRKVTTGDDHHDAVEEGHPALLDERPETARCRRRASGRARPSRCASCRCARIWRRRKAGRIRSRRGPRSRQCRKG